MLTFTRRSKQIESACFSGTAAFMEVRIQSVVVEFILNHVDVLFSGRISAVIQEAAGMALVGFVCHQEHVSQLKGMENCISSLNLVNLSLQKAAYLCLVSQNAQFNSCFMCA